MRISDWSSDVCSADPAEQAMEGVIAELSAALYLVDIDFTLHAEIIEEMITGESERPAAEIDEDVTEIASLAHEKVGHILFPLLNAGIDYQTDCRAVNLILDLPPATSPPNI